MDCWEFEHKLQRLNPRLYLGKQVQTTWNTELYSTGVYYRMRDPFTQSIIKEAGTEIGTDQIREEYKLSAKESREFEENDTYLGFCTVKHIPEGNWYGERGRLVARGWREFLLLLNEKKLVSLEKARRVFHCPSLGTSSYDKLNSQQKYLKYWHKDNPLKKTINRMFEG